MWWGRRFRLPIALLFTCAATLHAAPPAIRFEPPLFKVTGWAPTSVVDPADLPEVFTVYAGEGDLPPVLGSYRIAAGDVIFQPRFPLRAGVKYRAVFRAVQPEITATFEIPKPSTAPSTRVEQVYPTTNVLPGNQLKFYICFTAPMQRGEAWRRVHLYDASGKLVELPFLELQQELWDPDYKRLTVLFDPGRIKRGLQPLQEVGPAIEEGKEYSLVIDRTWIDASGSPLVEGFRKTFRVAAADRTPPETRDWHVTPPASATAPLVIDFPKPLDYALLLHLIEVVDSKGQTIAGSIRIEREETRWIFTPPAGWKPGGYSVRIDTSLEDLAGNRIGRPFDVDTFERVERPLKKFATLPFRVRGQ
jgi:hypothetical protein